MTHLRHLGRVPPAVFMLCLPDFLNAIHRFTPVLFKERSGFREH
jgi:hypothetical protein